MREGIRALVPGPVARAAYRAQHRSMVLPCLLGHRMLRLLANAGFEPPPDAVRFSRRRFEELLDRDIANAREGLYPESLLWSFPFRDYLRSAPVLLTDIPRTLRRVRRRDHEDFPSGVDVERYPEYFRRNFHWQTDGYFSRSSAERYDIGVELLFLGTADVMRRQIIPPITRHVRRHGDDVRVLDVACGTGRTLAQLSLAHPRLRYYGLDLSPYYVQFAAERLRDVEHLSLVAENAEDMPFRDGFFDVVTSVHLFHELPRGARHAVYREMFRVLCPGGLCVVEDSAQLTESGPMAPFLDKFAEDFHEPYHADYVTDDIGEALAAAGFTVDRTESHFVSKVVIAEKPR